MTTPAPEESPAQISAELLALIEYQEQARRVYAAQMVSLAREATRSFNAWYDSAAITRWTASLTRNIEALQLSLARSTDAYLTSTAGLLTERRIRPVGAIEPATLRKGVTHAGAYGRITDVYRDQEWEINRRLTTATEPVTLKSPLDVALARAEDVADMDSQLVVQAQTVKFTDEQPYITGYRRLIHPELSKGGTCGLCVAASDRLYGPKEPMPLHSNCKCLPLPVIARNDPGSILNASDLARVYKDAGGTSAKQLGKVTYKLTENGELGPLLTSRHRSKRRNSDRPRPPASKTAQVLSLEKDLETFQRQLPQIAALGNEALTSQIEARIREITGTLSRVP